VTLTEKSGHLAWCALVALALARQDGGVLSSAQENLFTRWLASALKQGVSLDIGNYCTVSLFFEQAYLSR